MSKLRLEYSDGGVSTEVLKKEIRVRLALLLKRDPYDKSGDFKKLEMWFWQIRLEHAGTDTKKLEKLSAVLYGRLGPLKKKLKENSEDSPQLSFTIE